MKSIIQFPHPGSEHNNISGVAWNTGEHKRKYLTIKGSNLKNLSTEPIENKLYFWGEWEAQSNAIPIINTGSTKLPNFIFEPYYKLPIGTVNTDPFVFGNQFYYCICKQGHYKSLRELDDESLILFGSNKDGNFVLDTMFVVKKNEEYAINEIANLKNSYNEVFYDVSLSPIIQATTVQCKETIEDKNKTGICIPICGDNENDNNPVKDIKQYRVYSAVMYTDRKNPDDIFSYVPCKPELNGELGFERPTINLTCISQSLNQGLKIIPGQNIKDIWNEITKQVIGKGLSLMIRSDLPTIKMI